MNLSILISFWYSSFKLLFTALSKSSCESEVSITCQGSLRHTLHAYGSETPNTKCIGNFPVNCFGLGHFVELKVCEFGVLLTSLDAQ